MIHFKTLLSAPVLGLVLIAGLALPAQADKITHPQKPAAATALDAAAIDFGDDTSKWANDGECDDPRFIGTGSAVELLEADRGHDATDCQTAFAAGTVALNAASDTQEPTPQPAIDFGDDASKWANDGECDDPRFIGTGSAVELLEADRGHDATDCQTAFAAGSVALNAASDTREPTPEPAIDFGNDASKWANDGECDDPRFSGTGVAEELLQADRGHDATDCQAALAAGTAFFDGGTIASPVDAFDYGNDASKWANDGECDDLRFQGPGTDKKLLSDDLRGDASDCKALEADGQVSIRTVYSPSYAAGAPYDGSAIDFGDDSSDHAYDQMCDDPRFEGPGVAEYVLEADTSHDRTDCAAGYEAGTIMLRTDAN